MRFQSFIDRLCHSSVCRIVVLQAHGDVVDLDADEGCSVVRAVVGSAADVGGIAVEEDEIDYHVERWEADASVDFGDILREDLFGGWGWEGSGWVVN